MGILTNFDADNGSSVSYEIETGSSIESLLGFSLLGCKTTDSLVLECDLSPENGLKHDSNFQQVCSYICFEEFFGYLQSHG